MGPLVYTSGNVLRMPPGRDPLPKLQWGRWFTPAETLRMARRLAGKTQDASMGPLVYTSGNRDGPPVT